MFGIEWADSQVFWLNLTNVVLGGVTLVLVLLMAGSIVGELYRRWRPEPHRHPVTRPAFRSSHSARDVRSRPAYQQSRHRSAFLF